MDGQQAVEAKFALMWECPACQARNYTDVPTVTLDRDQAKALLVQQGAITELDELPEEFGLSRGMEIMEEPDVVTCSSCSASYAAAKPDPLNEMFPVE